MGGCLPISRVSGYFSAAAISINPGNDAMGQKLARGPRSFCSLPNHIDYVSSRRTDRQNQLVSRYRDKALLIGAIPVWKGTAFDVEGDALGARPITLDLGAVTFFLLP